MTGRAYGLDEPFIVRGSSFERCQHPGEMNASYGEAGRGVYAYTTSCRTKLRPYYTSQGEAVFILDMKPEAAVVDLTRPALMSDLLAFVRNRFAERARDTVNYAGYQVPKVTSTTVQRFGGIIEDFVRVRFPDVSGWIVPHAGPGIPMGKQAVLRHIEDFDVRMIVAPRSDPQDDAEQVSHDDTDGALQFRM